MKENDLMRELEDMSDRLSKVVREILLFELKGQSIINPQKLDYSSDFIRKILFVKVDDHYEFNPMLNPIKTKIDYSNVSFDNVNIVNFDFTGMIGVKINPQTLYNKDLRETCLNGVEFIGEGDIFKGTTISFANFKKSIGARINPQTIKDKKLSGCILEDVIIYSSGNNMNKIDYFKDVDISFAKFKGCKGAIINPQTIYGKNLWCTELCDTIIMDIFNPNQKQDLFQGVKLDNTNFSGSKGAIINPQTVLEKNLERTTFADVEFVGPFDGVQICRCDFSDSKGAIIDLSKIKVINFIIYDINFKDAEIIGTTGNNIWWARNISLEGSKSKVKQKRELFAAKLRDLSM